MIRKEVFTIKIGNHFRWKDRFKIFTGQDVLNEASYELTAECVGEGEEAKIEFKMESRGIKTWLGRVDQPKEVVEAPKAVT